MAFRELTWSKYSAYKILWLVSLQIHQNLNTLHQYSKNYIGFQSNNASITNCAFLHIKRYKFSNLIGICWRHAGSSKLRASERGHGSLQITRLCHRRLQLVCFQTSTIECQEDGSSLVWNGGWTPQGGSSRQMSLYRFWRHSTSRCGSGLECLLRCSSVDEDACGSSCPVLFLPSSLSALDNDAILDETWPRDWYPPLLFQGWIIVTLCWLTCRPRR